MVFIQFLPFPPPQGMPVTHKYKPPCLWGLVLSSLMLLLQELWSLGSEGLGHRHRWVPTGQWANACHVSSQSSCLASLPWVVSLPPYTPKPPEDVLLLIVFFPDQSLFLNHSDHPGNSISVCTLSTPHGPLHIQTVQLKMVKPLPLSLSLTDPSLS